MRKLKREAAKILLAHFRVAKAVRMRGEPPGAHDVLISVVNIPTGYHRSEFGAWRRSISVREAFLFRKPSSTRIRSSRCTARRTARFRHTRTPRISA